MSCTTTTVLYHTVLYGCYKAGGVTRKVWSSVEPRQEYRSGARSDVLEAASPAQAVPSGCPSPEGYGPSQRARLGPAAILGAPLLDQDVYRLERCPAAPTQFYKRQELPCPRSARTGGTSAGNCQVHLCAAEACVQSNRGELLTLALVRTGTHSRSSRPPRA